MAAAGQKEQNKNGGGVMNIVKTIPALLLCFIAFAAVAQPAKEVREGNKLYQQQKYKEAAAAYQKALQKQPSYIPGLFNMGNAQYKQKQYEASRKIYEGTAKTAPDKQQQGAAHYNIGNSYMEEQKYQEAVKAYKDALRKNPQDEQAKYNLSYALQKLKQQQQDNKNQDKKNNQQQDKKDEKKDKQDQQKQDEKKDDQQQQQQNQQDKKEGEQEKEQRPQPQPSKLSEKQADQLLNALQQEEKKLQDKMKKGKGVPVKVEKDW